MSTTHVNPRNANDMPIPPYSGPIPTDSGPAMYQRLLIPSATQYYLSTDGVEARIPVIGSNIRDIEAWVNPVYDVPYMTKGYGDIRDPAVWFIGILEGVRPEVLLDDDRVQPGNTRILKGFLDEQRIFREYEDNLNPRIVADMLIYPFNPSADYVQAIRLTDYTTPDSEVVAYLERRGVRDARNAVRALRHMPKYNRFFYLTRFYGMPMGGNVRAQNKYTIYQIDAETQHANHLANAILKDYDGYLRYSDDFNAIFDYVNDISNPHLSGSRFGTSNGRLFYLDPFAYIALARRPDNLPELTFQTLRAANLDRRRDLADFLSDYTDDEIERLTGTISTSGFINRRNYLIEAARKLLDTKTMILTPAEAAFCSNQTTLMTLEGYGELENAYLGIGNQITGLKCYEIDDLLQSFEHDLDTRGEPKFTDIAEPGRNFTPNELDDFARVLREGRGDIQPSVELADTFARYAEVLRTQMSGLSNTIRDLRDWARSSEENAVKMNRIIYSYFKMGMYMRQWKGPGNPYPIEATQTGEEARSGTELEAEINVNVQREGIALNEYLEEVPYNIRTLFWELPVYRLRNSGNVERYGETLASLYRKVMRGSFCIRMASQPSIYSTALYHRLILGADIPGYSITARPGYII